MIELISQIDFKITARCYFTQPIGNRLAPSMLAAGVNLKKAHVIILCKKIVQSQRFIYSTSFFFALLFLAGPLLQKVSFN